jgi:hypothetical protein
MLLGGECKVRRCHCNVISELKRDKQNIEIVSKRLFAGCKLSKNEKIAAVCETQSGNI